VNNLNFGLECTNSSNTSNVCSETNSHSKSTNLDKNADVKIQFQNPSHTNPILPPKEENKLDYVVRSGLKCTYTNTDVLSNKLVELQLFIHTNDIDIVAITETLPKNSSDEDKKDMNFILPGFNSYIDNRGRGACLFVKNSIEVIRYPLEESIYGPSIICRICTAKNNFFTLCLMYRSPNNTTKDKYYAELQRKPLRIIVTSTKVSRERITKARRSGIYFKTQIGTKFHAVLFL
jgi:hypothetical protein